MKLNSKVSFKTLSLNLNEYAHLRLIGKLFHNNTLLNLIRSIDVSGIPDESNGILSLELVLKCFRVF